MLSALGILTFLFHFFFLKKSDPRLQHISFSSFVFFFHLASLAFPLPFVGIILSLCSLPLLCDLLLFFHFCFISLFLHALFPPYANIFTNPLPVFSLSPLLPSHSFAHSRSFFPSLLLPFPISFHPSFPRPLPLSSHLSHPPSLPLSSPSC